MQKTIAYVLGAGVAIGVVVLLLNKKDDPKEVTPVPSSASVVTSDPTVMHPPPTAAPSGSVWEEPSGGVSIPLGYAALEAKYLTNARAAMDAGDNKKALEIIENYERQPSHLLLAPQMTVIKIQALARVGRKTDALALAMETRGDDKYKDYHEQIEAIVADAGLVREPATPPMKP